MNIDIFREALIVLITGANSKTDEAFYYAVEKVLNEYERLVEDKENERKGRYKRCKIIAGFYLGKYGIIADVSEDPNNRAYDSMKINLEGKDEYIRKHRHEIEIIRKTND